MQQSREAASLLLSPESLFAGHLQRMNFKTIAVIATGWALGMFASAGQPDNPSPLRTSAERRLTMSGSPLGIAWGFLYGYLNTPAEQFLPRMRELGGGFTKVYLFWHQLEPEKGKYDWSALDAFVNQLKSPEEGLIALFSSSQWAVKHPAALLPPSAARNPDDYYRFVNQLVKHCK